MALGKPTIQRGANLGFVAVEGAKDERRQRDLFLGVARARARNSRPRSSILIRTFLASTPVRSIAGDPPRRAAPRKTRARPLRLDPRRERLQIRGVPGDRDAALEEAVDPVDPFLLLVSANSGFSTSLATARASAASNRLMASARAASWSRPAAPAPRATRGDPWRAPRLGRARRSRSARPLRQRAEAVVQIVGNGAGVADPSTACAATAGALSWCWSEEAAAAAGSAIASRSESEPTLASAAKSIFGPPASEAAAILVAASTSFPADGVRIVNDGAPTVPQGAARRGRSRADSARALPEARAPEVDPRVDRAVESHRSEKWESRRVAVDLERRDHHLSVADSNRLLHGIMG